MPGPHPIALRERAVQAYYDSGESLSTVAAAFSVGEASLKRWVWLHRDSGALAPKPRGRRPRLVTPADEEWLAARIKEEPTALLEELRYALERERGVVASRATVGRVVHRIGMSLKRG